MKHITLVLVLFTAFTQSSFGQKNSKLLGHWKGSMYKGNTYSGEHLPIKAHFKRENGQIEGTIHIQGATLPLQKIKVMKNDSVYFQMTQTTKNGNVIAKFNCHFKKKSLITGKIHQLGRTFSIKLNRYKPKSKPDHHKNNLKEISGTFTAPAYQNKSLGEYNQRQHSR